MRARGFTLLATALIATAGVALWFSSGPGADASAQPPDEAITRVAAARARVAAVQNRAERMDDINAIKNLQRSFGYYVDKMLWEHVVDLFADDATLEIGLSGVYVGRDSIRRYLYSLSGGEQGPLEGELYEHFQLQPVITLADDGRSAQGRWRAMLMLGSFGAGSGGQWGDGVYENEYVKEDGVWKIRRLHWYARFIAPYEGGWQHASREAVEAYSVGRGVEPDRPTSRDYAPYPGTFVPPPHYPNPVSGQ
jgi:hypothetical protein